MILSGLLGHGRWVLQNTRQYKDGFSNVLGTPHVVSNVCQVRWSPPGTGWIKLNSDGALLRPMVI